MPPLSPSGRVAPGALFYWPFRLVSASDHATPVPGASPDVQYRPYGEAAFVAAPPADVSELGSGYYRALVKTFGPAAPVAGPLVISAKAAGADDAVAWYDVSDSSYLLRAGQQAIVPFFHGTTANPHVGATGLSPAPTLYRPSLLDFGPASGSVGELGRGWYALVGATTAAADVGPILLRSTGLAAADAHSATYCGPGTSGAAAGRLVQVLNAIRTYLVESGLFAASCCHHILDDEPSVAWGTPFCSVAPGDQSAVGADVDGGGRTMATKRGIFLVRVYARTRTDPLQIDTHALTATAEGLGLARLAWKVESALQTWIPDDGAGGPLLEEPLRLASQRRPTRYRAHRDWIWCEMPFVATYAEILSADDAFQTYGTIF